MTVHHGFKRYGGEVESLQIMILSVVMKRFKNDLMRRVVFDREWVHMSENESNAAHITGKAYAAVDIGASSGRVLMGWVDNGEMKLEEVYRFDNIQKSVNGHDCWDIQGLTADVLAGLKAAK